MFDVLLIKKKSKESFQGKIRAILKPKRAEIVISSSFK